MATTKLTTTWEPSTAHTGTEEAWKRFSTPRSRLPARWVGTLMTLMEAITSPT